MPACPPPHPAHPARRRSPALLAAAAGLAASLTVGTAVTAPTVALAAGPSATPSSALGLPGRAALVRVADPNPAPLRADPRPTSTLVAAVDRSGASRRATASGRASALAPTALSTWTINSVNGTSSTGAVALWPAAAKDAVERAKDTWARVVRSTVPITVTATWRDLGDPMLLGQTSASFYADTGSPTSLAYPSALLDAAFGTDVKAGESDIDAEFNSAPTGGWHFGADPRSTSQEDFDSVVLHELGHGLGLVGSMAVSNGIGSHDAHPTVYDALARSASPRAQDLLAYASASPDLGTALTGGTLTWTGPISRAALGSAPVLYAPRSWVAGSSFSHLDEDRYPAGDADSLMTPYLRPGEVIRDPGEIAIGMLTDMGFPPVQVEQFVKALYLDFLSRAAESQGLLGWTDNLVSGRLSRFGVAYSLAASTESLNTLVTHLYADVLGRQPEPAGRDGWVRAIQGGQPVATVGAGFYASQENYNLAQGRVGGSLTPDQKWVESMYEALLGRPASPQERAFWNAVQAANGRLAVATSIYGAQENLVRRVNALYRQLLGRDADPTGLAGWPAVIARDGDLSLAATLASSQEYYARAQTR